uniref:BTB domain-containing protein n=1 Tax=Eptatretus burgeri TaxID=7764 RepID=A0A8C4X1G1_EPTBU
MGVCGAHRLTSVRDGVKVGTTSVVLSFSNPVLPPKVFLGYETLPVWEYIPPPLRFYKCQKFSHYNNCVLLHRPSLMAVACRDLSAEVVTKSFLKSAAFAMLDCGRVDVLDPAATLLGAEGINVRNEQGLTPLMFASCHGDEAMVQMLLDLRADPDVQVPSPSATCPLVHPQTRHYTVLMFATAHGHVSVCQVRLSSHVFHKGFIYFASICSGDLPMVKLLLSFGADPLVGTVWGGLGGPAGQRGEGSAISQAAAHGHRQVLHLLLSAPSPSCSPDLLSLAEILAEGLTEAEREKETRGDVGEHRLRRGRVKGREKEREHVLEEAMYLAAEHGYVDIVCDLRELGEKQTLHFKGSQKCFKGNVEPSTLPVYAQCCLIIAIAISHCYAAQTRSKLTTERSAAHASFVNSPHLSDVIFLVQGRPFHAHRVLLASSSPRSLLCFFGLLTSIINLVFYSVIPSHQRWFKLNLQFCLEWLYCM